MNAPFSVEQFLHVFVVYNAAIWPMQIAANLLGLATAVALLRTKPTASGKLEGLLIWASLAFMWAFTGIGYQLLFFSKINPAAILFAGAFIVQSILFAVRAALADRWCFETKPSFRTYVGAMTISYSLIVYPILGIFAGHGLMMGPMFGVAPCPTVIFTIGILLLARGQWVLWLSVIPILWSMVGLAAAIQLGIIEDLGLPIAGSVLFIVNFLEAMRREKGPATRVTKTGSPNTGAAL